MLYENKKVIYVFVFDVNDYFICICKFIRDVWSNK